MVQPRYKVILYFVAFILPALALYALFFLYPFGQGIRISFTNWDGLTPRTPITMPRADFEREILGKAPAGARISCTRSIASMRRTVCTSATRFRVSTAIACREF